VGFSQHRPRHELSVYDFQHMGKAADVLGQATVLALSCFFAL
jgi:hypothetical protein